MTLEGGALDTLYDTEGKSMSRVFANGFGTSLLVSGLILVFLCGSVTAEERFQIEDSVDWQIEIIDSTTNEFSENESAHEGDTIRLSIEIANSDTTGGHDEWAFHIELDGEESPPLTGFLNGDVNSTFVNLSFGPLPEGEVLLVLTIDSTGTSESLLLLVEPNPLNLTAAGGPEVALIGEPIHVGDLLTASILVHNQGTESATVQLELDAGDGSLSLGPPIFINPGSSREVSASFTPSIQGAIEVGWRVLSPNGGVARELNGSFGLEVRPSQTQNLVIDSTQWTLADGLQAELSIYLSEGRSRDVIIEVAILDQTIEEVIQSFILHLDPGRREISLTLGHPSADSMIVRISADGWVSTADLEIQTILIPPSLDLSVELGEVNPTKPIIGESVSVPYSLSNDGNTPTLSGTLEVVRTSDGMVLDSKTIQAVPTGGSISGQLMIESWPDSKVVEVQVIWLTSGISESVQLEIETFSADDGQTDLPFDVLAATYGGLSGLVLVMFILVVYRTVSENVEDTGRSRFNILRQARSVRKKAAAAEKREIPCPECRQRLSIPASHSGAVKCPACTTRFLVEAVGDESATIPPHPETDQRRIETSESTRSTEDSTRESTGESTEESIGGQRQDSADSGHQVALSLDDQLSCPNCEQRLRVPIERRPVKARCPACRSEFMAEVGEE